MSSAHVPSLRSARLACALLLMALHSAVPAQSEASRASTRLSESLIALPAASGHLLAAGGEFSVAALRPVGASMEVVLLGAVDGVRLSLVLGRETLQASGVVVGTTLVATAVSGGVLLWAGSEAIAFIADETLAPHIHRTELRR